MRKRSLSAKTFSSFIALLLCSVIAATGISRTTHAVSATDFNAGNIIDDTVFYNKDTMSVSQIQSFLNSQIPSCDVWGTGPSGYGNLTRAQYAQQIMSWPGPPYVCLTQYYENPNTGETSYEKGGGAFADGISAAQIIYNAAQQYGINPQVLLVMLKKESAGPLTADNWPLKSQYKYSMGYGCPDSGPNYSANCSAQKAGFYNQMMTAAWQLNYYKNHPNDYRYYIGQNQIQYSPDPNCGTKSVNIQNTATLSLYIYTPYTPNDAALRNYPGSAPCGAYGNRNFFMFFSEWFGSTHGSMFSNMTSPRKLIVKSNTSKLDPLTGSPIQNQTLSKGQVVVFSSKTNAQFDSSKLCLRTEANTLTNSNMCVLYSNLQEGPSYSSLPSPQVLINKDNINKIDPIDSTPIPNQTIPAGQIVNYTSSATTTDGKTCLRTEANTNTSTNACVLKSNLSTAPVFKSLSPAQLLVATDTVNKIDPFTGSNISSQSIEKGTLIKFTSQITMLDGTTCLRTEANTATDAKMCIKGNYLKSYTDPNFTDMDISRPLETIKTTTKIDPITGTSIESLPANLKINFTQKTYYSGKLCLRTATDTSLNKITCVEYSDLKELN